MNENTESDDAEALRLAEMYSLFAISYVSGNEHLSAGMREIYIKGFLHGYRSAKGQPLEGGPAGASVSKSG
jgi:hypothetical protein